MAKRNHKTADGTSVRFLTVLALRQPWARPKDWPISWSSKADYPDVPWIRLAGRWLRKAGFKISGRIRVEVQEGKLIITPE